MLDDCIFVPNTTAGLIAHKKDDVQKIFRIAKMAWDNFPTNLKPKIKYDNKNELYFADQNSLFYVTLQIRGGTTDKLHISEAAFIKNFEEIYAASSESVPQEGVKRIETTANGLGGPYYNMWMKAYAERIGDFKAHFFGWNWDPEYVRDPTGIVFTPEEREYQKKNDLSDEQLAWYQWKKNDLGDKFPQEYPITPEEAFIASGGNRFDVSILKEIETADPVETEEYVTYWELPKAGKKYVMGTDCSKGSQTGDWQVSSVVEYESGKQVAELRSRIDISRFTELSIKLGEKYNNALWGIELQDHGFTALNIAKKVYTNLYRRTKPTSATRDDKKTTEYGWSTNGKTKPLMIDELDAALKEGLYKPQSRVFVSEAMTYLEDPDGKTNAAEGCHDDTVIASAIAWQMRKHVRSGPVASKIKPKGL